MPATFGGPSSVKAVSPGFVVGVDLGGTYIKSAAFDREGKMLGRRKEKTDSARKPSEILDTLAESIRKLAGEQKGLPAAVGIGIPGIYDAVGGAVKILPNLPGWEGVRISEEVAGRLGRRDLPVVLENDANVAAIAEFRVGAARGKPNFMLVTIGTGIGGGILIGGRLFSGEGGRAGEIGHMKIAFSSEGRLCGCGARGCLEAYASGPSLAGRAREAIGAGAVSPALSSALARSPDESDPKKIYEAAVAGDRLALKLLEESGRAIGIAIANVANLLDLRLFVLAGGVAGAFDLLIGPIRKEVAQSIFGRKGEEIAIVPAICGEDAGVVGAGFLALEAAG